MATKQDNVADSFWIDELNNLWKVQMQGDKIKQEKLDTNNITQVVGCQDHLVVVGENGRCWGIGSNHDGQLSGGTFSYTFNFVRVYGIDNVVKVAVGQRNTVFLDIDGKVWACGGNQIGQISSSYDPKIFSPIAIAGFPQCVAISAGPESIYAVDIDGAVWSAGYSAINPIEFNTDPDTNSRRLRKFKFETPIADVSASQNACLFASEDGRTLWRCTQAGKCSMTTFDDGIKQISETKVRSMVLDGAGVLWSWYDNESGFERFPGYEGQLTSFLYPSNCRVLYLCTIDGNGIAVVPDNFWQTRINLEFVPLDVSNNGIGKPQKKSARKG